MTLALEDLKLHRGQRPNECASQRRQQRHIERVHDLLSVCCATIPAAWRCWPRCAAPHRRAVFGRPFLIAIIPGLLSGDAPLARNQTAKYAAPIGKSENPTTSSRAVFLSFFPILESLQFQKADMPGNPKRSPRLGPWRAPSGYAGLSEFKFQLLSPQIDLSSQPYLLWLRRTLMRVDDGAVE